MFLNTEVCFRKGEPKNSQDVLDQVVSVVNCQFHPNASYPLERCSSLAL